MATEVVVRGMVRTDGSLELAEPVGLPPGPVEVRVTTKAVPVSASETWWDVLQKIRADQEARGFVGRTREEIDEDVRQMRDEWEEHQLAIERLQEECWKARQAADRQEEAGE